MSSTAPCMMLCTLRLTPGTRLRLEKARASSLPAPVPTICGGKLHCWKRVVEIRIRPHSILHPARNWCSWLLLTRDRLLRRPDRSMDLLLTHGYFLYEDPKELQIMKPYPPLGILYICSHLREKGMDVEIFDSTFASRKQLF